MLELRSKNRSSTQIYLINQSISISQFSSSSSRSRYDVVATKMSSKQSTKILTRILKSLKSLANDSKEENKSTTLQESNKRLRSSICKTQFVDDSRKQLSTYHYHFKSSHTSNSRKIHIVTRQIDRKTIAKSQTSSIDNLDEIYSFSCSNDHERKVEFSQILREFMIEWI